MQWRPDAVCDTNTTLVHALPSSGGYISRFRRIEYSGPATGKRRISGVLVLMQRRVRSSMPNSLWVRVSVCVCEIIDTLQPASLLVHYRVYERRVSYVHNARVRLHRPWSLDPRHLLKWTRSSKIPPRKRRRCYVATLPPPPLLFLTIHVDKDDIREGYW